MFKSLKINVLFFAFLLFQSNYLFSMQMDPSDLEITTALTFDGFTPNYTLQEESGIGPYEAQYIKEASDEIAEGVQSPNQTYYEGDTGFTFIDLQHQTPQQNEPEQPLLDLQHQSPQQSHSIPKPPNPNASSSSCDSKFSTGVTINRSRSRGSKPMDVSSIGTIDLEKKTKVMLSNLSLDGIKKYLEHCWNKYGRFTENDPQIFPLTQIHLYQLSNFLKYFKTLPEYKEIIPLLKEKYDEDESFRKATDKLNNIGGHQNRGGFEKTSHIGHNLKHFAKKATLQKTPKKRALRDFLAEEIERIKVEIAQKAAQEAEANEIAQKKAIKEQAKIEKQKASDARQEKQKKSKAKLDKIKENQKKEKELQAKRLKAEDDARKKSQEFNEKKLADIRETENERLGNREFVDVEQMLEEKRKAVDAWEEKRWREKAEQRKERFDQISQNTRGQQIQSTQQDSIPPQNTSYEDKEGDGKGTETSTDLTTDDDKKTKTSTDNNVVDLPSPENPEDPESDPTKNKLTQIEEDKPEKTLITKKLTSGEKILTATKRSIVAGLSHSTHFAAQTTPQIKEDGEATTTSQRTIRTAQQQIELRERGEQFRDVCKKLKRKTTNSTPGTPISTIAKDEQNPFDIEVAREKLKDKIQKITGTQPPISTELPITETPTPQIKDAKEMILSVTKKSIVAGLSQATHVATYAAIDKAFDWWHQSDQFSGPVESRYTSFLIHPKIPTIPDFHPQHLHHVQPQSLTSYPDIVMHGMSQNPVIDADKVGFRQPSDSFCLDSNPPQSTTTQTTTKRTTPDYHFDTNGKEDMILPPEKRARTGKEKTAQPPIIIIEDDSPIPNLVGTDDPMALAEQQHFESIGMEGWQHTTRDSQTISVEINRINDQVIHLREQYQSTTFAGDAENFCVTARGFSELAEVFNQHGHVEEASNLISIAKGALEGVNLFATQIRENPIEFVKDMAVTGGIGLAIGFCCPPAGTTLFTITTISSALTAGNQIYNQLMALPPDQRVEEFTKIIVHDSIKGVCLKKGLRVTSKIACIGQDIARNIIRNKPLAKNLIRGVKTYVDLLKRYPQEVAQRALNILKQNPSLVEEQRDLGKAAAKVAKKVITEGKRVVGGAPKPSVPHAKPPSKPSSTKSQITKPRKPPSSRCKRPLDTAYEKSDSLVPAAAKKAPQPPAREPKKSRLQTQPATRAPLVDRACQPAREVGEVPKRVTRSAARAAKEQIEIFEKNKHHIFRNAPGHFTIDTLENRKLILDTARDPRNFLGVNEHGNKCYAKILKDGKQIWCEVRNDAIRNGGINLEPRPFNSRTGLSKPEKQ